MTADQAAKAAKLEADMQIGRQLIAAVRRREHLAAARAAGDAVPAESIAEAEAAFARAEGAYNAMVAAQFVAAH